MRMHPERVCTEIAACTVLHNISKRIPLPRHHQPPAVPEEDVHPARAIEDIAGRLVSFQLIISCEYYFNYVYMFYIGRHIKQISLSLKTTQLAPCHLMMFNALLLSKRTIPVYRKLGL